MIKNKSVTEGVHGFYMDMMPLVMITVVNVVVILPLCLSPSLTHLSITDASVFHHCHNNLSQKSDQTR